MISQFSSKISTLSSQVSTLISMVNKQTKSKIDLGGSLGKCMSSDEVYVVITHGRSLDTIMKWLEDWLLVDDELRCIACSKTFNYDYTADGTEFGNILIFQCHFKT